MSYPTITDKIFEDAYKLNKNFGFISEAILNMNQQPQNVSALEPAESYEIFKNNMLLKSTNLNEYILHKKRRDLELSKVKQNKDKIKIYSKYNNVLTKLLSTDDRYNEWEKYFCNSSSNSKYGNLLQLYRLWLEGYLIRTPSYYDNSLVDIELTHLFIEMNKLGFLTVDSQTYLHNDQRPYVLGYLPYSIAVKLVYKLKDKYQIACFSMNDTLSLSSGWVLTFNDGKPVTTITVVDSFEFEDLLNDDDIEFFNNNIAVVYIVYPVFNVDDNNQMFKDIIVSLQESY